MLAAIIESFGRRPWLVPAAVYGFLVLRYAVLSVLVHFLLWDGLAARLTKRRIGATRLRPEQLRTEIGRSLLSLAVIAALDSGLFFLFLSGHTQVYLEWKRHSWQFAFLTVIALFAWHDLYFYWLHRLLHTERFFRSIHYLHHHSVPTNACGGYSFHPAEALLQMLYKLPILLLVPLHPWTYLAFSMLTHIGVTSGHCGFEFLPYSIWNSWWGGWLTTSTHHNHHHLFVKKNFGLYLKFWDRLFRTVDSRTDEHYLSLNKP